MNPNGLNFLSSLRPSFSLLEKTDEDIENEENLNFEKSRKDKLLKTYPPNLTKQKIRKNVVRYLYLLIDYSEHLTEKEHNMNSQIRHEIVLKNVKVFVKRYFELNPLSKLGIVCTQNERAKNVCAFTGNLNLVIRKLDKQFVALPSGKPSLENSFRVILNFMNTMVPNYSSKEILILYSGIGTVDPGDIREVVKTLVEKKITVSSIGMNSKIQILEDITKVTHGKYIVPRNENEYNTWMMTFTNPLPAIKDIEIPNECIPMGFPLFRRGAISACFCHKKLTNEGYFCPKCNAKYCDIPRDCDVCNLPLVSYPHIAISIHHFYPVKNFEEIDVTNENVVREMKRRDKFCFGCQVELNVEKKIVLKCTDCENLFCIDCDLLIHENLHVCPGCNK